MIVVNYRYEPVSPIGVDQVRCSIPCWSAVPVTAHLPTWPHATCSGTFPSCIVWGFREGVSSSLLQPPTSPIYFCICKPLPPPHTHTHARALALSPAVREPSTA
jgi:hypothetical protein